MDYILYGVVAVGLVCSAIQFAVVFFEFKLKKNVTSSGPKPAVSILKPLKGMDDQLEANLISFFNLNYSKYEIIFGFGDADDPALPMVEALRETYPGKAKVVVSRAKVGLNPKVNTLHNLMPHVKYNHILISDSNVRVNENYLKQMVSYFQAGDNSLVTSSIRGIGQRKLGSVCENLHLNSMIAGGVLAFGRILNKPISIGKSMLLKKSTLAQIGGFASFADYLAEDYHIAEAVKALGCNVSTANLSIDNINNNWDMESFIHRHTRWAKMRLHTSALQYIGEFLLNPIVNSLIYLTIWPDLFSLRMLLLVTGLKILLDGMIIKTMDSDLKKRYYLLIPFKDLMLYLIWFIPFTTRKIIWRGNTFRITKNTQLLPLTQRG